MAPSNYKVLVLAHAVVFALALLWFIPIAIFAARFLKPVHHGKHASRAWFWTHMTSNVIATALIIAGFTLGYYASGNSFEVGSMNAHFIIGLTFFIGIILQITGGIIAAVTKSKVRSERKPAVNWVHVLFGYPLYLLGVANIWLGLQFNGSPHYLYALWIAAVAVIVVSFVVALVLRKKYEQRQQMIHHESKYIVS